MTMTQPSEASANPLELAVVSEATGGEPSRGSRAGSDEPPEKIQRRANGIDQICDYKVVRMSDNRWIVKLVRSGQPQKQMVNLQDSAFGKEEGEAFARMFMKLLSEGASKEDIHKIKTALTKGQQVQIGKQLYTLARGSTVHAGKGKEKPPPEVPVTRNSIEFCKS